MNGESRAALIERIFRGALALEPARQAEYLKIACEGDEDLRRAVESFLAHHNAAAPMERLSIEAGAGCFVGPHELISKLGQGGMGQVYLARDRRLGRHVALKFLVAGFATDSERKRRFLGEARAASALNHPNIVCVHDVGTHNGLDYLVMEYVPGKPLNRLIPPHGLKIKDALAYAIQIADALVSTHAAGIIHRDLKPGNVIVTDTGLVKVLDFGLAKSAIADTTKPGAETETFGLTTNVGTVLGTVAYMSPEQAEGKPVDARSDIFSFGSMVYELITGKRAFERTSTASTMAALLREDPQPLHMMVDDAPIALDAIVRQCLRKNPAERIQSMSEVRQQLAQIQEESFGAHHETHDTTRASRRRNGLLVLIASGALLTLIVMAPWRSLNTASRNPTDGADPGNTRGRVDATPVPLTSLLGDEHTPSLSPDGNRVAFVWNGLKQDNYDIYVKLVAENEPVRLTTHPVTDYAPSWSPDGSRIAFLRDLTNSRSALLVMPATGGPERRIRELASLPWFNARSSWHPNGKWLATADADSSGTQRSILLVSLDGEERRLTFPTGEFTDEAPACSPDGRRIVFVRGRRRDLGDLYVLALTDDLNPSGQPTQVTFDQRFTTTPVWKPDGRSVVYTSGTIHNPGLWQVRLADKGAQTDRPERLSFAGEGARAPDISRDGRLAYGKYVVNTDIWRLELSRNWEAAAGPATRFIASTRLDHTPQYSPDGKRIAFGSDRSGNHEIWVCNSDGSAAIQLTSLGGPYTASPFWSPDGQSIAFESRLGGRGAVYIIRAEGGVPKRVTDFDAAAGSWSRDGKRVYFSSKGQVWSVTPSGGAPVQVTKNGGSFALESQDGAFIYYLKDVNPLTTVWMVPAGGGEERQVLDSLYSQNLAVTEQGIYFIPTEREPPLQFFKFAANKATTITKLPLSPAYGLSVSPDRRWLLYTVYEPRSGDLMTVDKY